MKENRIAFNLTAAQLSEVEAAFQVIVDLLQTQRIVLSDADKQSLVKMRDGSLPFVEKVQSYLTTHPQIKPDYLIKDDLDKDLEGYRVCSRFLTPAKEIVKMLEDLITLSGSEAYTACLSVYRYVQLQAKDGRPNAKTIEDDLKQRFAQQGKKRSPKAPPPTA